MTLEERYWEKLEEGLEKGEERFALLVEKLLADFRMEDLSKATGDKEFRKKLYQEYGMQ